MGLDGYRCCRSAEVLADQVGSTGATTTAASPTSGSVRPASLGRLNPQTQPNSLRPPGGFALSLAAPSLMQVGVCFRTPGLTFLHLFLSCSASHRRHRQSVAREMQTNEASLRLHTNVYCSVRVGSESCTVSIYVTMNAARCHLHGVSEYYVWFIGSYPFCTFVLIAQVRLFLTCFMSG